MTTNDISSRSIIKKTTPEEDDAQFLQMILGTRFTEKTPVKQMSTIVTVGGKVYARRADISMITGAKKAGKTTVMQYIIATALMASETVDSLDTLGVKSSFCGNLDVVYVDTEGSKDDTLNFLKNVLRISGLEKCPDNLHIYHWRSLSKKENKRGIDLLFNHHKKSHLWVIDGVTDLLPTGPNDEDQSIDAVRWLMGRAEQLDTCFVMAIHDNPAKQGIVSKARGHFGSELERKVSGAIVVEKDLDKQCHYIRSRALRTSGDFDPICFWYEGNQPVSRVLTEMEKQQVFQKNGARIQELKELIKKCFIASPSKNEEELKHSIEAYQPTSPNKEAARGKRNRNLKAMIEHKLLVIEVDDSGNTLYRPAAPDEQIPIGF